jgi:hypothetical protein
MLQLIENYYILLLDVFFLNSSRLVDKRTGNIYKRIQFVTYCLPCFNELYLAFYPEGKKRIPINIGELLTPLGLAY